MPDRPRSAAAAQRAVPRHKVFAPATLNCGGVAHRAHVIDVSAEGVQVDSRSANVAAGSVARLGWSETEHPLFVVWVRGSRFGARFVTPLAETVLAPLLSNGTARVAPRAALG